MEKYFKPKNEYELKGMKKILWYLYTEVLFLDNDKIELDDYDLFKLYEEIIGKDHQYWYSRFMAENIPSELKDLCKRFEYHNQVFKERSHNSYDKEIEE